LPLRSDRPENEVLHGRLYQDRKKIIDINIGERSISIEKK
jgi:hypothetical protein